MYRPAVPLTDVERIEIVRGPQSALYGSDALGGVINIITKKPESGASGRFSIKNSSLPVSEGSSPAWQSLAREQTLAGSLSFPIGPTAHRLRFRRAGPFHIPTTRISASIRAISWESGAGFRV
jgi:outer membrane receptor protein involved in Fe transport